MLTQTLPRSQAAIHLQYPFACLPCLITYLATCVYTNPPPTHRPTDLHIDIQSRRHVMYIYTRRNTDAKKHRHVTQEARTHTRTHTHTYTHTQTDGQTCVSAWQAREHKKLGGFDSTGVACGKASVRVFWPCFVMHCPEFGRCSAFGQISIDAKFVLSPAGSPCRHCHVGHSRTSPS